MPAKCYYEHTGPAKDRFPCFAGRTGRKFARFPSRVELPRDHRLHDGCGLDGQHVHRPAVSVSFLRGRRPVDESPRDPRIGPRRFCAGAAA